MKQLKLGILICGALGLVGMVMTGLATMLESDKVNTIIMLAAFGLPVLMAVKGLAKPPFLAWQAGVSLAGFALCAVKVRIWETISLIGRLPAGTKLMIVGAGLGVILSIIAVIKPESNA